MRSSAVRLPASVHGEGDHGFVPALISIAREKGASATVGEGSNRWPAVHRLDATCLFRLALEEAPARSYLHGVGDEGVHVRDIAEVIGRHLDVPTVTISPEEADDHFGWLSFVVSVYNPTLSTLTRERLGWTPSDPRSSRTSSKATISTLDDTRAAPARTPAPSPRPSPASLA